MSIVIMYVRAAMTLPADSINLCAHGHFRRRNPSVESRNSPKLFACSRGTTRVGVGAIYLLAEFLRREPK